MRNPAVSGRQYRMAQAVLSGSSKAMPLSVARELVDRTPERDRSRFMRRNPKGSKFGFHIVHPDRPHTYRRFSNLDAAEKYAVKLAKETGQRQIAIYEEDDSAFDRHFLKFAVPNSSKQKNPDMDGAKEVFEEFHGYPSSGELDIAEREVYRDELAQLGSLEELEVCLPNGKKVIPIGFDHHTKVCVSTDRKQLYFVGGDQELDLAELIEAGLIDEAEAEKDMVAVGPVHSISYFAKKVHLQGPKNAVPYIHEFGEDKGVYPELVYDRLNKRCLLAGGSYMVKDTGIAN